MVYNLKFTVYKINNMSLFKIFTFISQAPKLNHVFLKHFKFNTGFKALTFTHEIVSLNKHEKIIYKLVVRITEHRHESNR